MPESVPMTASALHLYSPSSKLVLRCGTSTVSVAGCLVLGQRPASVAGQPLSSTRAGLSPTLSFVDSRPCRPSLTGLNLYRSPVPNLVPAPALATGPVTDPSHVTCVRR